MKTPRSLAVALASLAAAAAVTAAALTVPTRPVSADAPKVGAKANPKADSKADMAQVKALYSEKCSACHNLPNPDEKGYSKAEWQRTVTTMLTKYRASDSISPTEAAQIVTYLGTFAPKAEARKGGRQPADPWATDALDVWTDAPAATRVFNFAAANPLSAFQAVGSGTPGAAPAWQVVSDGARANSMAARISAPSFHPDRFALLIDRADQGRNLDVRVRFRIDSGKDSPAVGLAFGLADPDHYTVLRCNQALGDLALIQIAGPTHTTLQQTPLVLASVNPAPANGAAVAAPPVPLAPGWHTLRLLVKDGQVRGWLDMQKRINTSLPEYGGGKVALWTQGSTAASFHDWTVDWYDAPKAAPLS